MKKRHVGKDRRWKRKERKGKTRERRKRQDMREGKGNEREEGGDRRNEIILNRLQQLGKIPANRCDLLSTIISIFPYGPIIF